MKMLLKLLFIVALFSLLTVKEAAAETSLQSLIDQTPEGGVLRVEKGAYEEAVVIKKAIVLVGAEGTVWKACSSQPAITVSANNVTLKNMKLAGCSQTTGTPAIL